MLIEPILYWLVASWYYKKIITDRQCVKNRFLTKLLGRRKSEWRQKWKSRPNMKEGAQGRGFDPGGRHHLSPTALKLK